MHCDLVCKYHLRTLRSGISRFLLIGALAASILPLGACSNGPQAASPALDEQADTPNDPLEKGNRVVWAVDLKLNDYVLTPVAKKYRDNLPQAVRHAVTNVLHNLESPVILLNDALQGNGPRAGDTFARLWLNTILGLGGLIDVGTASHIPFHEADFGQTLGVWGVGPGPYLVLPLLGPSDPRDLVGKLADSEADPYGYALRGSGISTEADLTREAVDVVNSTSQHIDDMAELRRSSLDFYAAVRSLYQQERAGAVRDGKARRPDTTSALPLSAPDPQAALLADAPLPSAGAAGRVDLAVSLDRGSLGRPESGKTSAPNIKNGFGH